MTIPLVLLCNTSKINYNPMLYSVYLLLFYLFLLYIRTTLPNNTHLRVFSHFFYAVFMPNSGSKHSEGNIDTKTTKFRDERIYNRIQDLFLYYIKSIITETIS